MTKPDDSDRFGSSDCYADAYWALIAARGSIPDDLRIIWLTEWQVEQALFRVEPLEFMGDGTVKCVHPEDFQRFDELLST